MEELIYKVAIIKQQEEVGVGIEQLRIEDGRANIVWFGSYFIGSNVSRQATVRFYVNEILKRHNPGDPILIRIGDENLRFKRNWLMIYRKNIEFKVQKPDRFKTCQMMAFDAVFRKTTITERL